MLCGPYWVGWMYGLSGSVCQEGGRVVWGEGLGAEGAEVGVVGGGEGVDGFGGGEGLLAEGCGFAARLGVEDEDAVGEVGDAGVAAGGGGGGGAAGRRVLSGKVESRRRRPAARGSRQGWGNAHGGEGAGGGDGGGREAGVRMGGLGRGRAQQKFEELLFDGGLGSRRRG